MNYLLHSADLFECYCWQIYITVSNTDLYLSYFTLRYVFPGHNESIERGLTVYECLLTQAEWWVAELLFLSLNNWGLNFLQNKCSLFFWYNLQFCYPPHNFKKTLLYYSCQLEIDHVPQQPKETCRRTWVNWWRYFCTGVKLQDFISFIFYIIASYYSNLKALYKW